MIANNCIVLILNSAESNGKTITKVFLHYLFSISPNLAIKTKCVKIRPTFLTSPVRLILFLFSNEQILQSSYTTSGFTNETVISSVKASGIFLCLT